MLNLQFHLAHVLCHEVAHAVNCASQTNRRAQFVQGLPLPPEPFLEGQDIAELVSEHQTPLFLLFLVAAWLKIPLRDGPAEPLVNGSSRDTHGSSSYSVESSAVHERDIRVIFRCSLTGARTASHAPPTNRTLNAAGL